MTKRVISQQTGREAQEDLIDETYGSSELASALPKSVFPDAERDPRNVFAAVRDELMLDGNSRQNLATFCQTWEEPEIHRLMDICIDKNMIDKDEYPQTAEIESRCVHMLANLWNAPASEQAAGCSTRCSIIRVTKRPSDRWMSLVLPLPDFSVEEGIGAYRVRVRGQSVSDDIFW